MFYLTLRKRKLSPVPKRRIRECGGRREWGEDYYRLMESAVARAQRSDRQDKGRPMCRRRGEHEQLKSRLADPAQSDWREKRAIQVVAMTSIAEKPGGIPKTVKIEYIWECSLQIRPPLINKNREISQSRNCL